MCPHTAIYVSSYCEVAGVCVAAIPDIRCGQILLYMCSHTAIYVSSYCYMCPHTVRLQACVSLRYLIYDADNRCAWKSVESDVAQVLPHVMLTYAGVYVC